VRVEKQNATSKSFLICPPRVLLSSSFTEMRKTTRRDLQLRMVLMMAAEFAASTVVSSPSWVTYSRHSTTHLGHIHDAG